MRLTDHGLSASTGMPLVPYAAAMCATVIDCPARSSVYSCGCDCSTALRAVPTWPSPAASSASSVALTPAKPRSTEWFDAVEQPSQPWASQRRGRSARATRTAGSRSAASRRARSAPRGGTAPGPRRGPTGPAARAPARSRSRRRAAGRPRAPAGAAARRRPRRSRTPRRGPRAGVGVGVGPAVDGAGSDADVGATTGWSHGRTAATAAAPRLATTSTRIARPTATGCRRPAREWRVTAGL